MRIYKLKADKVNVFKQWATEVMTKLKQEAQLAIEEENIVQEIFSIFEIQGQTYIAVHITSSEPRPPTDRAINLHHKAKMKECIDSLVKSEIIIDITNFRNDGKE